MDADTDDANINPGRTISDSERWKLIVDRDAAAARWLTSVRTEHTRAHYRTSIRLFCERARMAPSDLIREATADRKLDPLEKTDMPRQRVLDFYAWLKTDAPRRNAHRDVVGKGMTDGTASTFVSGLQAFYAYFELPLRLRGAQSVPRGRITNKRIRLNADQVKVIADNVRSPRDRAIVWVTFQSGMDADTLCSMRWGQAGAILERDPSSAGDRPARLDMYRAKEDIRYTTFMGRSAVDALRAYANDLEARGISLADGDPLFIRAVKVGGAVEALEPDNLWLVMKGAAVKAGFLAKGAAYNTCGLHALRESFSSIMLNAGMQREWIDAMLGHTSGSRVLSRAYFEVFEATVGKAYAERMHLLEPGGLSKEATEEELKRRVREELDERTKAYAEMIGAQQRKVSDLEEEVVQLRKDLTEISKRVQI